MDPAPRGGGGTIQRHESPTSTLPIAEGPEAERFEEPPPSTGGEPRESGPVGKKLPHPSGHASLVNATGEVRTPSIRSPRAGSAVSPWVSPPRRYKGGERLALGGRESSRT